MSPKLINQKKIQRTDRAREIIHELMECESVKEFRDVIKMYDHEIITLHLTRNVAAAIKRLNAIEINQSFNNN